MLGARDFCCSDGSAFQRGKQDAPERISYSVPITGLKRLGGEFGVSICGCALILGESFRHLKATVTDWHNFSSRVTKSWNIRVMSKDTKYVTSSLRYSIPPPLRRV